MTRYARKAPVQPLPASNWEEMVSRMRDKGSNADSITNESNTTCQKECSKSVAEKSNIKQENSPNKSPSKKRKRKQVSDDHDEVDIKQNKVQEKPKNSLGKLSLLGRDLASALENNGEEEELPAEDEKEEALFKEFRKKATKGEIRRLKRIEMRQKQKVCFNCRKPGHALSSCPDLDKLERGVDICFRCGSCEHKVSECKTNKVPNGKFPFANCFICGEIGHLSRNCPDNNNGVYPNGGCCLNCGSIYHFKRACPELQKRRDGGIISLKTADACKSLDEDPTVVTQQETEKEQAPQKKKQKVVKF